MWDSICCMIAPRFWPEDGPNPVAGVPNVKTEVNGEGEAWIDPIILNSVYDTRSERFAQDSYQKTIRNTPK
jgi:hypothetical protein